MCPRSHSPWRVQSGLTGAPDLELSLPGHAAQGQASGRRCSLLAAPKGVSRLPGNGADSRGCSAHHSEALQAEGPGESTQGTVPVRAPGAMRRRASHRGRLQTPCEPVMWGERVACLDRAAVGTGICHVSHPQGLGRIADPLSCPGPPTLTKFKVKNKTKQYI